MGKSKEKAQKSEEVPVVDRPPCPEKEGWLLKQGALNKAWKKRWFILRDYKITYHEAVGKPEKGTILLKNVVHITATVDHIKPEKAPKEGKFIFSVQVKKGRCYILQADDEESKTAWLETLNKAWDNYGHSEAEGSTGAKILVYWHSEKGLHKKSFSQLPAATQFYAEISADCAKAMWRGTDLTLHGDASWKKVFVCPFKKGREIAVLWHSDDGLHQQFFPESQLKKATALMGSTADPCVLWHGLKQEGYHGEEPWEHWEEILACPYGVPKKDDEKHEEAEEKKEEEGQHEEPEESQYKEVHDKPDEAKHDEEKRDAEKHDEEKHDEEKHEEHAEEKHAEEHHEEPKEEKHEEHADDKHHEHHHEGHHHDGHHEVHHHEVHHHEGHLEEHHEGHHHEGHHEEHHEGHHHEGHHEGHHHEEHHHEEHHQEAHEGEKAEEH